MTIIERTDTSPHSATSLSPLTKTHDNAVMAAPVKETSTSVVAHLMSIGSVVRRPPVLRAVRGLRRRIFGSEKVFLDAVESNDELNTVDLAQQIAMVLVRHGQSIGESDDPDVQAGLIAITQVITMYEHLFMMQTAHSEF